MRRIKIWKIESATLKLGHLNIIRIRNICAWTARDGRHDPLATRWNCNVMQLTHVKTSTSSLRTT